MKVAANSGDTTEVALKSRDSTPCREILSIELDLRRSLMINLPKNDIQQLPRRRSVPSSPITPVLQRNLKSVVLKHDVQLPIS